MNCGDATAAEVDQEVMKILKDSYEEAKRLLSENREAMDKIAEFLIQKETITGKEFMKLFREAKGIPEPEEEESKEKDSKEKDSSDEKPETEEKTDAIADEKTEENPEEENKEEPEEQSESPEKEPPVVIARERH